MTCRRSGEPKPRRKLSARPSCACCSNGLLVEVVGSTEKVRVECHWHGGSRTTHELTRPVARLAMLSTYAALTARAAELRHEGLRLRRRSPISSTPKDGARPSVATPSMRKWFIISSSNRESKRSNIAVGRRHRAPGERMDDPRTRRRDRNAATDPLHLDPEGTPILSQLGGGSKRAKLVRADPETIAALKAIRATPPPWRRPPPGPANSAATPATES